VWGEEQPDDLLEWLGIPPRHRVLHDSTLDRGHQDRGLDGLVLLDLPDHDSTEVTHHLEVERLVGLTDLMVWVLDPQKYADLAVHERFLAPLASHAEVMLVVLNHIDEVSRGARDGMLADVRRLLKEDGLGDVPLLATSARTGEGTLAAGGWRTRPPRAPAWPATSPTQRPGSPTGAATPSPGS
jgi:hypothetical protein